jgi:hypothetical protein
MLLAHGGRRGEELQALRTQEVEVIELLENVIVTLEQREARALERANFARILGTHVGEARALARADGYAEVRRMIAEVLNCSGALYV